MNKGIMIAGTTLVDVIQMVNGYPEQGMLETIKSESFAVGGCLPNTGIDIKKIDKDLPLKGVARVGNDDRGRFLLSELDKYGVDCTYVKTDDSVTTSYSNVVTVMPTGQRTFFHWRGANAKFSHDDIPFDNLDCDIFHIGYLLLLDILDEEDEQYGTKMARVLHDVKTKGVKTSIDVVSETTGKFPKIVVPALKYCDYCILNEVEAGEAAGIPARNADGSLNYENVKKILHKFMDFGVGEVVIVHCPECGFALDKNGRYEEVGSLSLPKGYIKGSVGAGDAFCAGSLYGFYKGMDLKEILKFASAVAACNLSAPDSISGVRSYEETLRLESSFERKSR